MLKESRHVDSKISNFFAEIFEKRKPKETAEGISEFLSPYQRYLMLKPYLKYMTEEGGKNEAEKQLSDDQRIKSIQVGTKICCSIENLSAECKTENIRKLTVKFLKKH